MRAPIDVLSKLINGFTAGSAAPDVTPFQLARLNWEELSRAYAGLSQDFNEAEGRLHAERRVPRIHESGQAHNEYQTALKAKHRVDELETVADQSHLAAWAALIAMFNTPAANLHEVLRKLEIADRDGAEPQVMEGITADLRRLGSA